MGRVDPNIEAQEEKRAFEPGMPPSMEQLDSLAQQMGQVRLSARTARILQNTLPRMREMLVSAARQNGWPVPERSVVQHNSDEALFRRNATRDHVPAVQRGLPTMQTLRQPTQSVGQNTSRQASGNWMARLFIDGGGGDICSPLTFSSVEERSRPDTVRLCLSLTDAFSLPRKVPQNWKNMRLDITPPRHFMESRGLPYRGLLFKEFHNSLSREVFEQMVVKYAVDDLNLHDLPEDIFDFDESDDSDSSDDDSASQSISSVGSDSGNDSPPKRNIWVERFSRAAGANPSRITVTTDLKTKLQGERNLDYSVHFTFITHNSTEKQSSKSIYQSWELAEVDVHIKA